MQAQEITQLERSLATLAEYENCKAGAESGCSSRLVMPRRHCPALFRHFELAAVILLRHEVDAPEPRSASSCLAGDIQPDGRACSDHQPGS